MTNISSELNEVLLNIQGKKGILKALSKGSNHSEMFFYYINNLISNNENSYIINSAKKALKDFIEDENNSKNNLNLDVVLENISQHKDRVILNLPYENSIKFLKDEFNLDDLSIRFLLLYFDYFAIKSLKKLINNVIEGESVNEKLLCSLISCSEEEFKAITGNNSLLVKNGIITDTEVLYPDDIFGDYGRYIIQRDLYRKMCSFHSNKDLFFENVIGKVLEPTLLWEDYENVVPQKEVLASILKGYQFNPIKGLNIMLRGIPGTGKTEFTKTLAKYCGYNIWSIAEVNEQNESPKPFERIQALKFALSFVKNKKNSLLLFDESEDILDIPDNSLSTNRNSFSKIFINRLLEENNVPVIWVCNNINNMHLSFVRRMTYVIEFETVNIETREKMISKILSKYKNISLSNEEIKEIAKKWKFTPSIIENAILSIDMANGNFNDLNTAIKSSMKCFGNKEDRFIKSVENFNIQYVNCKQDLNYLTNQLIESNNKNWSLCIEGKPGTGKSEYGKYLAHKMNMSIIEYKASDLLGSYVGETEKNIAKAFLIGKQEKAVLIFDEVESLIYNRENSERSFEISQVNSFLIELENYNFPIICTTNLFDFIDKAALRRFVFKLKFEPLNEITFHKIFENYFNLQCNQKALNNSVIGDFVCVLRKENFIQSKNSEQIYKWLIEELELRKEHKEKLIGFF